MVDRPYASGRTQRAYGWVDKISSALNAMFAAINILHVSTLSLSKKALLAFKAVACVLALFCVFDKKLMLNVISSCQRLETFYK